MKKLRSSLKNNNQLNRLKLNIYVLKYKLKKIRNAHFRLSLIMDNLVFPMILKEKVILKFNA
jgi:hypothetical protein